LLDEAAADTDNASLKKFLDLRAEAFLDNDYLPSDFAWMDLDSPVDITIGPYETYNDELFGYKAAFEAYVNIRDQKETQKLDFFAKHMQELEDNLPLDASTATRKWARWRRWWWSTRCTAPATATWRADGRLQPAERRAHHQRARLQARDAEERAASQVQGHLTPISKLVLTPEAQQDVDFDSFFTHILAHEIMHGLGPHATKVDGKESTPRQDLKEAYSTIEKPRPTSRACSRCAT
jgi:hypothetical protein